MSIGMDMKQRTYEARYRGRKTGEELETSRSVTSQITVTGFCHMHHTYRKVKSKPSQQPQLFRLDFITVQHFNKKFTAPCQIP